MTEKNLTEDDPENMFIDVNRYEVEESAIFQDYSLEVLQKSLNAYKSLNIYERTSLAKNIDSIRVLYNKQDMYYQFLDTIVIIFCFRRQTTRISRDRYWPSSKSYIIQNQKST